MELLPLLTMLRTFALILVVVSTFTLSNAQEQSSFTEKVDLKTRLLGMSLLGGRLGVVTSNEIRFLQVTENGLKEIQSPVGLKTGIVLRPPSEFKLLEDSLALICDEYNCRIGDFSAEPSWDEYVFPIELPSAAAVSAIFTKASVLNARVVGSAKSTILRYGEDMKIVARADDMGATTNLTTVLAFERDGYSYFLGSAKRAYEPDTLAELADHDTARKFAMRLTRVCNVDGTKKLQSRIDLALACGEDKENLEEFTVSTATYDVVNDRLVLLAQKGDTNGVSKEEKICSFRLPSLEQAFENTWNICQNTPPMLSSKCKYRRKGIGNESSGPNCFIHAHHGGSSPYDTPCSTYNNLSPSEKLGNCDLVKSKTTSYQYAWLEQFQPFVGEVLARLPSVGRRMAVSLALAGPSAAFALYNDGSLIRVLLDEKANSPTATVSEPLWNASLPIAYRQSIAVANNRLAYLNDTIVESIQLTCASLYQTCEMVVNKTDVEPLGCGWCALSDGTGYSISKADNNGGGCVSKGSDGSAGIFFATACPPLIDRVMQKSVNTDPIEWEVVGTRLDTMTDLSVKICGQMCTVIKMAKESVICSVPKTTLTSSNCALTLTGQLSGQEFAVKKSLPILVPSNQLEDSPGVGTAIIAICIVVVFVLVGLCAVALYVRRRRSAKKQNDARAHAVQFQVVHNGSGSYLMTSHNGLRGNSNTYMGTNSLTCDDAMALGIDNPYERLFQDVDTRLRIAQDDLRFDTEVGRGNFGVVNKATYTPANGVERKVACKMLRPGISGVTEFLKEGLIMENFKHPRVMPLIGISFTTDNFAPIIVTEFMANGDLVKYLRDANNTPTLRQLLNFAVQIAEGMQYLHKCKFIHRDLAARNCMLDGQLQIKIADFGLCRPVSKYESYEPMHRNRDMPLRWLSIEALEREEFTFKGDVWAYGVVLWELMTRGAIPYTGMQGYMLIDFLKNGQRLERPPYCPAQLYDSVMKKCWQAHPADRPTFADLVVSVPAIISALERSQASQSQLNAHYEPVSFGANASANSATSTSAGSSPSNITSV